MDALPGVMELKLKSTNSNMKRCSNFHSFSFAVQFSREPGWLEGTLNGKRGLIPQNYVQFL